MPGASLRCRYDFEGCCHYNTTAWLLYVFDTLPSALWLLYVFCQFGPLPSALCMLPAALLYPAYPCVRLRS